jgi:legumain
MLIYFESNEAASLFEKILPKSISILAITSSRSNENSFASYCFPGDTIKGKNFGTCLGDVFSDNWMNDL